MSLTDFIAAVDPIQAERILRIETPLGPDVLLPERFEMREAVNDLFELTIAVRSKDTAIEPADLIGRLVDVSLETGAGTRRTWNGLCSTLQVGPAASRGLRSYRLTLRPQHWLLTRRTNCRIFRDKTSLDIADILLSEHGIERPDTSGVIDRPDPEHYSVQWNENDWSFLVRRLEADGLMWWMNHEGGRMGAVAAAHRMHIADHQFGYMQAPGLDEGGDGGDVRFAIGSADRNRIDRFERTYEFTPGQRSGADWNFLTPGTVPANATPSLVRHPAGAHGNETYELYEYPSHTGYGTGEGERGASEGIDSQGVEKRSKLRMLATEADHERIHGSGDVRTLAPGRRFKPYDVANPDNVFEEHAIASITHTATDRSYETSDDEPDYSCTFEAVPGRVPLTPHRITPRPRIDGQQVAIVAGPDGEEIHTDEFGRVKVWFPWDRTAKKDGTDTCWLRVAQSWAGNGWGAQVIPRIGMEVLVSYLDGDPDRPLVTGVVPNTRQKVPYALPADKTKSVFRTNTHHSQNRWNANELTFEDAVGREEIFIHSERDRNEKTNNNHSERIDRNWAQSIGSHKGIEIERNLYEVVRGSVNFRVGPSGTGHIASMPATQNWFGMGSLPNFLEVGGIDALEPGIYTEVIDQEMHSEIGNVKSVDVGQLFTMRSGRMLSISSEQTLDLDSGRAVGISANQNVSISAGGSFHINCGDSSIILDADGTVYISGKKLVIDMDETTEINADQRIHLSSGRIDLND